MEGTHLNESYEENQQNHLQVVPSPFLPLSLSLFHFLLG